MRLRRAILKKKKYRGGCFNVEHIFLIRSSGKRSHTASQLIARIRAAAVQTGALCLIREYRYAGDIESFICRDAARGGAMRFYVSGSDAALCAAARVAAGFANAEIGILPDLSGSDFTRGYPGADFASPAAQIRGTSQPVDLINCNGQTFISSVRLCTPHPTPFQRADRLNPPVSLAAACDDGTLLTGVFTLAGIGNGSFADRRRLFPMANPSDGKLDLVLQRARSAKNGPGAAASTAPIRRQCSHIVLIPQQPLYVCGDGQKFRTLRLSCSILRGPIRFIVPAARYAYSSPR